VTSPRRSAIREKVETFNTFTPDNDPHRERDFGAPEHNGERIFWKIDYYAPDMEHGSEDPADPPELARDNPVSRPRSMDALSIQYHPNAYRAGGIGKKIPGF
jgi:transposase InsO family protein